MTGRPAPSSSRSAKFRAKLQHIRGHHFDGRAARFRSRQQGIAADELDFMCVASLPDWVLADEARQVIVGLGAAILQERQAIDRELAGDRLAAIAELVGNEIFERLCDCTLPDLKPQPTAGRLPRPEDFASIGASLRRAALPSSLRDTDVTEAGAARARRLCDLADSLVTAADIGP